MFEVLTVTSDHVPLVWVMVSFGKVSRQPIARGVNRKGELIHSSLTPRRHSILTPCPHSFDTPCLHLSARSCRYSFLGVCATSLPHGVRQTLRYNDSRDDATRSVHRRVSSIEELSEEWRARTDRNNSSDTYLRAPFFRWAA